MVKIDWYLFFRHRVILGFYLTQKYCPGLVPTPRNWIIVWSWKFSYTIVPWHRTWRGSWAEND